MRRYALLLLLLGACGADPPAPPPEEPTRSPGERYVQRDVCPFECCVYGEWKALRPIDVLAEEAGGSAVAFRLAAGERFTARTGNVHLDPPGLAVALDTVRVGPDGADAVVLLPGDTVEILSPRGEGHYSLRSRGRIFDSPGFWEVPHTDPADPDGEMLRRPAFTWWVRAESARGESGWIPMHQNPRAVWGSDACGGPEPPDSAAGG